MANFLYNSARRLFADGEIKWSSNTHGGQFTSYKIMAALVNKSGGNGIQNYTPPSDLNNDNILYVPGQNGSRNMYTEFGYGQPPSNSSLIRDGSDNVILAELTNRYFVPGTGACDADDITFLNVPINPGTGTFGAVEGLVIFLKNESQGASTDGSDWPVIAFIDTLTTGVMNITPNGGDIIVQWNSAGIFRL